MKYLRIVVLIICLTAILSAKEFKIEFVKAIGDERDTHTFFRLSGAALSANKDIYVVDLSGHFIAKYNWDGTFVKRIGQQGAGPGDFGNVNFLTIDDKNLYVYDNSNSRIVRMDLDLNILKYTKMKNKFFRYAYPVKNNRFLGDYMTIRGGKDSGRIGIVDQEGELLLRFFNALPIEKINMNDRLRLMKLSAYSTFGMDLSPDKEKVLIHFYYPPNPLVFFIYNIEGELIKTFTYEVDKKYQFPEHYLEYKPSYPTPYHYVMVYSAFFYKDNYIVFYREISQLSNTEQQTKDFCLVFDRDGKMIQKTQWDNPIGFLYLSPDGYLLGSGTENEIVKLFIYTITLVK